MSKAYHRSGVLTVQPVNKKGHASRFLVLVLHFELSLLLLA